MSIWRLLAISIKGIPCLLATLPQASTVFLDMGPIPKEALPGASNDCICELLIVFLALHVRGRVAGTKRSVSGHPYRSLSKSGANQKDRATSVPCLSAAGPICLQRHTSVGIVTKDKRQALEFEWRQAKTFRLAHIPIDIDKNAQTRRRLSALNQPIAAALFHKIDYAIFRCSRVGSRMKCDLR